MSALYHNLIYRFKERMVYLCSIKDVKSVFCKFFPGSVCRSPDMPARRNSRSTLPLSSAKVHSWGRKIIPMILYDSSPEVVKEVKRLVVQLAF